MIITEHTDERGDYLVVACDDGQTFTMDAMDRSLLGDRNWHVNKSRGYEACNT